MRRCYAGNELSDLIKTFSSMIWFYIQPLITPLWLHSHWFYRQPILIPLWLHCHWFNRQPILIPLWLHSHWFHRQPILIPLWLHSPSFPGPNLGDLDPDPSVGHRSRGIAHPELPNLPLQLSPTSLFQFASKLWGHSIRQKITRHQRNHRPRRIR